MASMNKVLILGNLGQDPEMRYTQSGTAVTTMSVATSEQFTGKDGQKQEKVEWHRIIAWGKQAESCAKYLKKGSSVLVEGKLQTRKWEDANKQTHYTTEINATSVTFVGTKGDRPPQPDHPAGQAQQQQSGAGYPDTPGTDEVPF